MRRGLSLVCLTVLVLLGAAGAAVAQETPSSSSVEFWPEIDLWLRLSPSWRLSSFAALSKNIETAYREGSLILQADFAWGRFKRVVKRRMFDEDRAREMRAWMARVGYLNGRSLDDQGEAYREDTALVELHLRNPLKGRVLVSHRLRMDFRWLGEEREFSARARYRLMLEKELLAGRTSIIPYVNVEPSFDSRYQIVNRVRLCGGATVSWWRPIALEGNFTYQHDSKSSITEIYAVNVILHVFF